MVDKDAYIIPRIRKNMNW